MTGLFVVEVVGYVRRVDSVIVVDLVTAAALVESIAIADH